MSGLVNYDEQAKNQWRGWQWNRIAELLPIPTSQALCLYLSGPDDLDRAVALKKGFQNENLIAVDLSEENVATVRAGGGIAICGDLKQVVAAWPGDLPINAVVADFCWGLGKGAAEFLWALAQAQATRGPCVASVNLQRGRDPWSNEKREFEINEVPKFNPRMRYRLASRGVDHTKHRGWLAMCEYSRAVEHEAKKAGLTQQAAAAIYYSQGYNGDNVAFYSYRASRVYMDSAVFRLVSRKHDEGACKCSKCVVMRRKIAACRAVRTTRLRAAA